MEYLLSYIVDTTNPNYLGFKLLGFHPYVKKFFLNNFAYYDKEINAAVVGSPILVLSEPNGGTMGVAQYIKGFISENEQQFKWKWLFFKSNKERDSYKEILCKLLQGIARESEYFSLNMTRTSNPRVIFSYK